MQMSLSNFIFLALLPWVVSASELDLQMPTLIHAESTSTHADPTYTHAEPASTHAHSTSTHVDPTLMHADPSLTHADPTLTHADPTLTLADLTPKTEKVLDLISYWITSHSIALTIPKPRSAIETDHFPIPSTSRGSWWWVVATPADNQKIVAKDRLWPDLVQAFGYTVTGRGTTWLQQVDDPKLTTVQLNANEVVAHFRALPSDACMSKCRKRMHSFIPEFLKSVKDRCIIEIVTLSPNTTYSIVVFNIREGTALPNSMPKPVAEVTVATKSLTLLSAWHKLSVVWEYSAWITMLVGVSVILYTAKDTTKRKDELDQAGVEAQECNLFQWINSDQGEDHDVQRVRTMSDVYGPDEDSEEGEGNVEFQPRNSIDPVDVMARIYGFTMNYVSAKFTDVFFQVLKASCMIMPFVGPFGLYFAKNIVLGVRLKCVRGTWARLKKLWKGNNILGSHMFYFLLSLWQFLINIFFIPYNLTSIQEQWPFLLSELYSYARLNPVHSYSVDDIANKYVLFSQVSEVEIFYAIPVTIFSAFLLASDDIRVRVALEFNEHKTRAKECLAGTDDDLTPVGTKLEELQKEFAREWKKTLTENKEWGLCSDEMGLENDNNNNTIRKTVFLEMYFLLGSIVFSIVPRWWMCVRYGASWHGSTLWTYVLMYFVNMTGLVFRFLKQSYITQSNYHTNVDQLAVFQAISWNENEVDVRDPMQTCNDRVEFFRKKMKSKKLEPLDLAKFEDAQTWWKLREMMLLDIKDERISMELHSVVCFLLFCGIAACSVYTTICFGTITMLSLLSTMIILVLGRFNFLTLKDACDINSMCKEHVLVLRRKVLEIELSPTGKDEENATTPSLLEEFARVIEEEGETETIMSLPITATTFVIALCIMGIFGMSSLMTVLIRVVRMQF